MDATSSNSTLDVSLSKEHGSEVSAATTSSITYNMVSDEAKLNQSVVHTASVPTKRIIRKITPLDPKKLQKAGLDRKIAEALSKQKSQHSSKPSNRFSNAPTSVVSSAEEIKPTSSKNMKELLPAKNPVTTKIIIPPTITITGPEAITEHDSQKLSDLNPQERLVHVKNLLNKKLLQKKSTVAKDNVKNSQHLKPPPSLQLKLPFKLPKEPTTTQNLFCVLKEPSKMSTPPVIDTRPLKINTPQDIARKLDFQTDAESKPAKPENRQHIIKCLNKGMSELKPSKIQRQTKTLPSNPRQFNKQLPHAGEVLTVKQSLSRVNVSHEPQNFQDEYLRQQKINYRKDIPKAKIKSGQKYSYQPYSNKQLKQSEQILNFTEVSPLKVPFPTVNVPKETPLPAIESFKKPYPMVNPSYYNFQQKSETQTNCMQANYETVLFNQQPTTLPVTSTTSFDAAAATSIVGNSLIVLENKVLSQDEMIDLTELRLSTSNFDTPGFANPHKPIPEVVIKEENTDEYPITDISTPVCSIENTSPAETSKEIQTQSIKADTERVVISNKQNKKIIINAQKLKLPPEQLADLAKKIKQKSLADKEAATNESNQLNKLQKNIRIINTKAANKKTPTTNAKGVAQTPKEMPVKFIIQNKQIYVKKQDEPIIFNSCDKSQKFFVENLHDATTNLDHNKSVVEIVDEPLETEDCFSAVDFIAALSNTNPITEETSLELSPEELNLNASCAMNLSPLRIQSYPSNKKTATIQKTSTPNINDNTIFQSPQLGTIVIESSKGPETILTKDSPNRFNDTKRANKIQMAKVLNNTTITEREIQKSLEILSNPGCHRKWDELTVANKADYLETKAVNDTPKEVNNPKLLDNLDVCDMEIEKCSESAKKVDDLRNHNKLSTFSLFKNTTNIATRQEVNAINTKDPSQSKTQLDVESNNIIDLTDSKVVNDTTNQVNLTISNVQRKQNFIKAFMSTSAIANTTTEDLPQTEVNCSQKKVDQQKSEPVTSKRISRFKKGKINLVQRHKTGQRTNKPLLGSRNFNENKDFSDNKAAKTNVDLITYENRPIDEEEVNKSLIEPEEEIYQVTNQTTELAKQAMISFNQKEDNIKEDNIKEDNMKEDNIKEDNIKETEFHLTGSYNVKEIQASETTNLISLENDDLLQKRSEPEGAKTFLSKTFVCAIPKAFIKMSNSSQQHSNSPESDIPKSLNISNMDIPKDTVKIGNPSQQHSKSAQKGLTKSTDSEISNIPKAAIKSSNSSQQLSNTSDKSFTKTLNSENMDIPKASVKIGNISQQHSKSPTKCLAKSTDSHITNIPKSPIKMGNSSQHSVSPLEICFTKSLNSSNMDIPKAAVKIANPSHQHSTSAEKGLNESIDSELSNIPKTSIKAIHSSQQLSNSSEKSFAKSVNSDSIDISKSSVKVGNISQQHSNTSEKNLTKCLDSDITAIPKASTNQRLISPKIYLPLSLNSDNVDITKVSVKVGEISQQLNLPEKSLTKSSGSGSMNISKASVNIFNTAEQQHSISLEKSLNKSMEDTIMDITSTAISNSSPQHSNSMKRSLSKSLTTEVINSSKVSVKKSNSSSQQISKSTDITYNKYVFTNITDIQNASIITRDSSQQIFKSKEKSFTKSLNTASTDVPKASIKVNNSSHHSNSSEICYTSMDKAKALVNIADTMQQLSNTQEKSFIKYLNTDNMEIPKASIKLDNNLQAKLKPPEIAVTKSLNSDNADIPKDVVKVSNSSQQLLNSTEQINNDNMDIPKASVKLGNSSQHHLNSTEICFAKSFNSDNINIPKASIKTVYSRSQDQSKSPNASSDKQKIHSSEITPKKVTDVHKEALGIVSQQQQSPQTFSKSEEFQNNIGITKSCTNIGTQFEHHKTHTALIQQPQVAYLDQDSIMEDSQQEKNLNRESEAALKSMKNVKVSLIDIVKYSPIKSQENSPIIPFKKVCHETSETSAALKGITTLLKQQIASNQEKQEQDQKMKNVISVKETRKIFAKVDERKVVASKRICRSNSKTCERQTETPPLPSSSSPNIRHSKRPLISDDDLEFLPENAEVKFKLSKSKQNQKSKECNTEIIPTTTTTLTTPTHNRRQSLYSKPLELDLSSSTSPLNKRTRYYSQTLERNVTITFDALKTNVNFPKNLKSFGIEESDRNDSRQYSNTTTTTKQRTKLLKTREDKKDSQKSQTDSEDDNRDYDCFLKDCEESNEFLGFEEISDSNSFKNTQHDVKENQQEAKIKHGTLKNWLTTGKAISPTFDKLINIKRFRHDDELPSSSAIADNQGLVTSKRCWNLDSNLNEDTDITDDTSPADDEEEMSEKKSIKKYYKRGTKNVIISNKKLLENKKNKLENSIEHSFIKPRDLHTKTKNHAIDSDEKAGKSQKSKLKIKSSEENLPKTTKSREHVLDSKCKEEKETNNSEKVIANSSTESDNHEKMDTRRLKLKYKTKITEKHSRDTNTDTVCHDRTESEQLKKEEEKTISKSLTSETSNCQKEKESKSKDVKDNKDKDLDSRIKSYKLDNDRPRSKKSNHTKLKQTIEEKIIGNLDISQKSQQLQIVNESKNINSAKEGKSTKLKTQDLASKKKSIGKNQAELETSCATPQNLTIKRKRGRPRQLKQTPSEQTAEINTSNIKEVAIDRETSSLPKALENPIISDDEGPLPSAKRRCLKIPLSRKMTNEDSDSESIATMLNETQEKTSVMNSLKHIATPRLGLTKNDTSTPSAGRKRKSTTESNFNSRLLLITKREQLDTDDVITQTNPGPGAIQCGLCLGRTQPSKWILHVAEHYGVGWQVGEERVHIENRSVVLSNITNYMKGIGSKGLACRMCKKVYRSGLGLLMHIEACGAEVIRLECEFCKKDYAKSSLPIHMRSCYARSILENQSSDENVDESNVEKEQIFGNSGRLKRSSTIKAENKLKVLGEELGKMTDNMDSEPNFDPKSRIKYVPPLEGDFSSKWCQDIETLGQASCPNTHCKFISKDVKELYEHLKNCKYIKSGYFCNYCPKRVFQSENEAIEHVLKNHPYGRGRKKSDDSDCNLKTDSEQSSDDDDLSEGAAESELDDHVADEEEDLDDSCDYNKSGNKITKKPYSRNLNKTTITKEVFDGRSTDLNKEVLRKWKNFLNLNHSCEPLYVEFTTQYSVVKNRDFYKYLPTQTVSMKYNFKTKPTLKATIGVPEKCIEWSELKRYESVNNKRNTYFFLGAPVKLCVWVPLPAHVTEQYLAVVYRQDMFKFIKFSQPKQHHTIVLIFKVIQNNKVPQLNVHYGLILNDGPVHHLSFLPSGGYDESANRLGLVAIATVNSCIKVYSLPLNVESEKSQENCGDDQAFTLIDVRPNFLLNLDILSHKDVQQNVLLNTQCLQICWSEYSGHQHIFASFSNGFIGIWDISNDPQQNLNRFVIADIINYVPLNYFYIGEKGVKCLAVHYDTCGPRWLAVSSAYRKFVIYDIKTFTQPIIMKEDINKNILMSMDWSPVWEVILNSYCDTILNNGRCVICVNPTNVKFLQNKLDFMVCGVTQVHYTPVTNMCVAGMTNGDIVFLDTKELHYECALSKKFGERRLLYAMDVKQLNGQPLARLPKGNQKNNNATVPSDWLMQDDNYKEKYGLVFEPLLKLKENDKKSYLNDNRCPPVNIIPLMRINTLRCNLNFNSKSLIALGYENGFLRLVYLNKETFFCK